MRKGYRPACDRCFWCNVHTREITRDHVIPVSFGGRDFANIVWACQPCNGERGQVSNAIKLGRLDLFQALYQKWVEIETRELGHSPTASLVSMVAAVSPAKDAESVKLKSGPLRKCCHSFIGRDPHQPGCYQLSLTRRKCCDTLPKCSPHLPSCKHEQAKLRKLFKQPKPHPTPPTEKSRLHKLKRARGELFRLSILQWQDDGGANTDIGDALGEERPELLERMLGRG